MFTQPCFIQLQNSVDVRLVIDKLNNLGYKPSINQYGLQEGSESTYIICKSDGLYYFAYSISYYTNDWGINCIDNKELFFALAALRDDANENQWFTDGEIWVHLLEDYQCVPLVNYILSKGHKATVEEIIEHFKDK